MSETCRIDMIDVCEIDVYMGYRSYRSVMYESSESRLNSCFISTDLSQSSSVLFFHATYTVTAH